MKQLKKTKKAVVPPSPVGSKVRHCIFELRCLSQGLSEQDFAKMKAVINKLEGCALHIEEIEQYIPVSTFLRPLDPAKIANKLGASLGD